MSYNWSIDRAEMRARPGWLPCTMEVQDSLDLVGAHVKVGVVISAKFCVKRTAVGGWDCRLWPDSAGKHRVS